jgi:hypothetical protein
MTDMVTYYTEVTSNSKLIYFFRHKVVFCSTSYRFAVEQSECGGMSSSINNSTLFSPVRYCACEDTRITLNLNTSEI